MHSSYISEKLFAPFPNTERLSGTIHLQDSVCQVNDRILNLLLTVSNAFKRLNEQDLEFKFPDLPTNIFKAIVNVLHTARYDMGKAYALLEGFSILECQGLSKDLETKLAKRIQTFKLEDRNFISCIHAFVWAETRNLTRIKNSLRKFVQRYIEANFDKKDIIAQVAHEIDGVNAKTWIPLALDLKKFRFSPEFFDRLKLFSKSLVSLNFADINKNLTEEDLDQLKCLVQLRSLILSCRISCALNLSSLSELHTLTFRQSDICDDDLKILSIPLSILQLKRCQRITGVGLQHISHNELISLTLTGSKPPFFKSIGSDGFETIGAFKKLRELNLKRTLIRGGDLHHLYPLTCLTHLDLTNSICLDDSAIEKLQNFVSLVKLFLNKCSGIKGWGLKDLPKQLQTLSLADTLIDGESFDSLKNLYQLSTLNLSGCIGIRSLSYGCLGNLSQLKSLYLSRSSVTDEGVKNLRILPYLAYLDLQDCKNVSGETSIRIQEIIKQNSQTIFPRSQIMQQTGVTEVTNGFVDLNSGLTVWEQKIKKVKQKLRTEKKESQEKFEELRKMFTDFKADSELRHAELKVEVLSQQAQNNNLKEENDTLVNAIKDTQASAEKLFEQLMDQQNHLKAALADNFKITQLLKERDEENALDREENKKLKEQLDVTQRVNEKVQKQLQQLEGALKQLEGKLESQQDLLSKEKSKVQILEQHLIRQEGSFEQEKQKLHALNRSLKKDKDALTSSLGKIQELLKETILTGKQEKQKLLEDVQANSSAVHLLKQELVKRDIQSKEENEELKKQLEQVENVYKEAQKQLQKFEDNLKLLSKRLESQQALLSEKESKVKDLEQQVAKQKDTFEEEKQRLHVLREEQEQNHKIVVEGLNAELETQVRLLADEKAKFEAAINGAGVKHELLKQTYVENEGAYQRHINMLRGKLAEQENLFLMQKAEFEKKFGEVEKAYKRSKVRFSKAAEEFEEQTKEQNAQKTKLVAKINILEKETDSLTEDIGVLVEKKKQLKADKKNLQGKNKSLTTDRNNLEKEKEQLQGTLEEEKVKSQTKINKLKDKKKALETNLDELEEEKDQLEEEKDNLEKEKAQLIKDKKSLKKSKDKLTTQVKNVRHILSKKKGCAYLTQAIFSLGITAYVSDQKNLKKARALISGKTKQLSN